MSSSEPWLLMFSDCCLVTTDQRLITFHFSTELRHATIGWEVFLMSFSAIRLMCTLAAVCSLSVMNQATVGQSPSSAEQSDQHPPKSPVDPFVGKWKLNPSKSEPMDEMKVSNVSGNKYSFDFGAGKPEVIVADGTDQPGGFGTTLAVTVEGPTWQVVRKQDGHTIIRAKWELSQNGNTLIDHFTNVKADGSENTTTYKYRRTSGTAGFPGTWENTNEGSTLDIEIRPFGADGLSFTYGAGGPMINVEFDGKEYPGVGVPAGFTASGRRINERTVQMSDKMGSKEVDTRQTELSSDMKTMTLTVHKQNQSKARVLVFDRE